MNRKSMNRKLSNLLSLLETKTKEVPSKELLEEIWKTEKILEEEKRRLTRLLPHTKRK